MVGREAKVGQATGNFTPCAHHASPAARPSSSDPNRNMTDVIITRPARPADEPAVSALHAAVFGPGRFARTAYRIREGVRPRAFPMSAFCRVAVRDDCILASVTLTEIQIGGVAGALMLGPLAIAPEIAGQGYGRRIAAESLEAARNAGFSLVLLVGDEPYYARLGFQRVPPGRIVLPGPVDPQRLLACELKESALANFAGLVTAA